VIEISHSAHPLVPSEGALERGLGDPIRAKVFGIMDREKLG